MIARIVCYFRGHLRGKFVRQDGNQRVTACPRCGKETARTVKQYTEATA